MFLLEIIKGIHQIDDVIGNVYLLINGDKLVLIDTGFPGNEGKIRKYIEKLGFNLNAVSTIILTHYHIDHTGNAKKLKEETGAQIAIHQDDTDFVTQKKTPPRPKSLLSRAIGIVKAAPVEPDIVLRDGDKICGLQVIHTPGHTPGSIALFDAERKVMFVGDTVFYGDDQVEGPEEKHTLDMALAYESIGRIASFDFDVMLSGHREPLTVDASKKIKRFVATQKK